MANDKTNVLERQIQTLYMELHKEKKAKEEAMAQFLRISQDFYSVKDELEHLKNTHSGLSRKLHEVLGKNKLLENALLGK